MGVEGARGLLDATLEDYVGTENVVETVRPMIDGISTTLLSEHKVSEESLDIFQGWGRELEGFEPIGFIVSQGDRAK